MAQQNETLTVGLAQIAPVWLKKDETILQMSLNRERQFTLRIVEPSTR